jgi:hypothetical protein
LAAVVGLNFFCSHWHLLAFSTARHRADKGSSADRSISFQAVKGKLQQLVDIISKTRLTPWSVSRKRRWRRVHVHQPQIPPRAYRIGPGGDCSAAPPAGTGRNPIVLNLEDLRG